MCKNLIYCREYLNGDLFYYSKHIIRVAIEFYKFELDDFKYKKKS